MVDVKYIDDAIGKMKEVLSGLEGVTIAGTPIESQNSVSQSFKFRKNGLEMDAFVQFNPEGCTHGTVGIHSRDPTVPFPEDFVEAFNREMGSKYPYSSRAHDMEPPEGDYTFYWRDLYLH